MVVTADSLAFEELLGWAFWLVLLTLELLFSSKDDTFCEVNEDTSTVFTFNHITHNNILFLLSIPFLVR